MKIASFIIVCLGLTFAVIFALALIVTTACTPGQFREALPGLLVVGDISLIVAAFVWTFVRAWDHLKGN